MKTVFANRYESSKYGTFSIWKQADTNFTCHCIELPWRNNQRRISCIPAGEYIVKIRKSPKYGDIYHVKNVTGRSYILIHSGNYAGDVSKGLKSHSMGCLLLGLKRGWLKEQKVVLNSRIAVKMFMDTMQNETFKLIITNNF